MEASLEGLVMLWRPGDPMLVAQSRQRILGLLSTRGQGGESPSGLLRWDRRLSCEIWIRVQHLGKLRSDLGTWK